MKPKSKKSNVLADHKKSGKTLIPPIMQIPNVKRVSYGTHAIPEFLWLAILNSHYGWSRSAELSVSFALKAVKATEDKTDSGAKSPEFFPAMSSFSILNNSQKAELVATLKLSLEWEELITALSPLISWYPGCPLNFLFENGTLIPVQSELEALKEITRSLFDRNSNESVSMFGNAFAVASATKKLRLPQGIIFEDFIEIEQYPETEKSREMAHLVRTAVLPMLGVSNYPTTWPDYFWNRGLEISPCEYKI